MKRYGTFYELVFHFVWATKQRLPMLTPTVEACLCPYLAAKCAEQGYVLHAANGVEDHIHLLVELSPTVCAADVAKQLKGASSHYINHDSGLDEQLYWQDGYAVISLRKAEIPKVAAYIDKQKQHHQTGKLSPTLERIVP